MELAGADLFKGAPEKVFEPAGEECGTGYDESRSCPVCGGGAPQTTPLFLERRRIPRGLDFAETIAGEMVVSRSVVELFQQSDLRGASFDPVRLAGEGGEPSGDYYQLRIVGVRAELDPKTSVGDDPFDEARGGRCPRGDIAGLNLLSEVSIRRETYSGADLVATREFVGVRRGLLRPRPILLLSPKAWCAVEGARLLGLSTEVAHAC